MIPQIQKRYLNILNVLYRILSHVDFISLINELQFLLINMIFHYQLIDTMFQMISVFGHSPFSLCLLFFNITVKSLHK